MKNSWKVFWPQPLTTTKAWMVKSSLLPSTKKTKKMEVMVTLVD